MEKETSGINEEIQKIIFEKLNAFNQGKTSGKYRYDILLPNAKTRYYTLWFYNPDAAFHPFIFLCMLDLNSINSIQKAIQIVSNSFYPLLLTSKVYSSFDNGDDILTFGKYRGYHLYQVNTIDPRYISWIADKYEPRVKSEQRFKDLAISYSFIHQDLHTPQKYKIPVSQHIGAVGDKLMNLALTITHVRLEDNPYKTRIQRGVEQFYVDQIITAADTAGNLYLLIVRAKDYSLASQTLNAFSHGYQTGEQIQLSSAKIIKHFESRHVKYTKLGYIKF